MKSSARVLFTLVALLSSLSAKEFSVLVFNVENLFDIDGVAEFEDYRQEASFGKDQVPYSPALLHEKLKFIVDTLVAVDDGAGPDIVLFQEFERDRTPQSSVSDDPLRFLDAAKNVTLEEMLSNPSRKVLGLPAHAFVVKALSEAGLIYPYVAMAEEKRLSEDSPAHINVIFSRFPIVDVDTFPTPGAREVVVAELDVGGNPFFVVNNHWKSGASNADTEPTRVENAKTVRAALDDLLGDDPAADVLIGGDLNTYYNQSLLFPEMEVTGVNTILLSQGDERAVAEGEKDLYNLWFELPLPERYTEAWRDFKGTLMQMLVTPGLYDNEGIRYVDNSFDRVLLPGRNIDEWGRPIRFSFEGGGRGGSDHLPILARFEVVDRSDPRSFPLTDPGQEDDQPNRVMLIDYNLERGGPEAHSPNILEDLEESEMREHIGKFFEVDGVWESWNPPTVRVADVTLPFYSSQDVVWSRMGEVETGDPVRFFAELVKWDDEYQWLVRDPSWLMVGRRGLEPRTN